MIIMSTVAYVVTHACVFIYLRVIVWPCLAMHYPSFRWLVVNVMFCEAYTGTAVAADMCL